MFIVKLIKALSKAIRALVAFEDAKLANEFDKGAEKREGCYELERKRKEAALSAYNHSKRKATECRQKGVDKVNARQAKIMQAREELNNL